MSPSKTHAPKPIPRRSKTTREVGPITFLIMCALHRLPTEQRYGSAIEQHLSSRLGQLVELSQVYIALKRLKMNEFVTDAERPTPGGTSHKVIIYSLTPSGREALRSAAILYRVVGADAAAIPVD